jgi:phenylacetate-CoA ligase
MWWLKRQILRGKYRWRGIADRDFAWGVDWCRRGWRLPAEELAVRQLAALCELIAAFRRSGQCQAEAFEQFRQHPTGDSLAQLPLLTKTELRQMFPALRQSYSGRDDLRINSTGGSTGEPVFYLRSRQLDHRGAGASHAMLRLLGWQPGMARVSLWGSERDIGRAERHAGWLERLLADSILIGGFAPGEREYRRFVDAVRGHRGCAVYGFTSLLTECARLVLDRQWEIAPGTVSTAWVGAEKLSDEGREMFHDAFHVKLRDHYGSRECSSIAAECEHGTHHINPRYIVEVADYDTHQPLAAGQEGVLLVTDLFNDATPLIRYEIGDIGAVAATDCRCGRRGPQLAALSGRLAEMFALPSGKRVSSLYFNHLLKHYPAVHQFQVLQLGDELFEVHYTGEELPTAEGSQIVKIAARFLEGAQVRLAHVTGLDRSPSGKLVQYRDLRSERKPGS